METENLDIPREDEMEDGNHTPAEQSIDEQAVVDANQSAPNQQLIALTPAIQQLLESNGQLRGQQQYIVITSKGQNQFVPVLLTNSGTNGTVPGDGTTYEEQQDPNNQAIPYQAGITYQTIDDRSNPAVLFCRDISLMDQAHARGKELYEKGTKLIQKLYEVLDELEKPPAVAENVDTLKKNAEEFKELLDVCGVNAERKEWMQRQGIDQILPRPAGRIPINDLRNSTQKNKALRKILNPVESALIRYEKINLLTALRELPEFASTFQMMMMQPTVSDFQQEHNDLLQRAQEAVQSLYSNSNMTEEQAQTQEHIDSGTFVDITGKKRSISELTTEEINEITKRLKVTGGDIVTGGADQLPLSEHDQTNGQDPNGTDVDSQVLNLSSLAYTHPLYFSTDQVVDGTGANNNVMEDEASPSDSEHNEMTNEERRNSRSGSRSRFPQNTKEEWGFDADDVKREFEEYMATAHTEADKKGLKWAKIAKKLGTTKFLELGDCGPKVKAILRRKYPEIIGEKVKIPTDPKSEWGFTADDIKAKIEELSNIAGVAPGSPHKSISMSKIGAILGTAKPKGEKLRPIAERKDRGQLVHALLKSKYPDLAAKFQRQGKKSK